MITVGATVGLCLAMSATAEADSDVIPAPLSVTTARTGRPECDLSKATIVATGQFGPVASMLSEQTGLALARSSTEIRLILAPKGRVTHKEGYRLSISPRGATIEALTKAGAICGAQTLRQCLLVARQFGKVPCFEVVDEPRFGYRGVHLDVSRHFFPTEAVERFIDLISLYKFNRLHLHLTDGPGWRLEIKSRPELTRLAAWRTKANMMDWWSGERRYLPEGDPAAYGGYYTQKQAREMVAFAARRGVTVIPEIEIPGHSEEVLAAYPELSCTGLPYKHGEFCPGKEATFKFLEQVLSEVIDIFPSKSIHIGGDEVSTKSWGLCPDCRHRMETEGLKSAADLQAYTMRRVEAFLAKRGRKAVAWDEVVDDGMSKDTTIMNWRGDKFAVQGARMGHQVVRTSYLDTYQADPRTQPPAIGGYLPLKSVYAFRAIPNGLLAAETKLIAGLQACFWSEYIPTPQHLDYMAFPRLIALSEVAWSTESKIGWPSFQRRLQAHYRLLQRLNVNYFRPSAQIELNAAIDTARRTASVTMSSERYGATFSYTLDGSPPSARSEKFDPRKDKPLVLTSSAKIRATDLSAASPPTTALDVDLHVALGRPVKYLQGASEAYPAQGERTLTDGLRGTLSYHDGRWQGFLGGGLDVIIDLGESRSLRNVSATFMQQIGPGVFVPDALEAMLSEDGEHFQSAGTQPSDVPRNQSGLLFKTLIVDLKGKTGRYLRVRAPNSSGGFIFCDEIVVY